MGTATIPKKKSRFQVRGNRILNLRGEPFILRGVVVPYGYFYGSQGSPNPAFDKFGWGQLNLSTAARDFTAIRALGANLVRVMVTYDMAASETGRAKLAQVVGLARHEGLIVEIAGGDRFHENAEMPVDGAPSWMAWLAGRWKDDPYVWISPVNEPNCDFERHLCRDWKNWQREHQVYVNQIRASGNTAPVIVNTISWSWDLSQIADYLLQDPLNNIIYGAHRYANRNREWTEAEAQKADLDWANLARVFPIMIDETGAYNGEQECGSTYHIAWNQGFLQYAADWIEHRGGNGVTGFAWYWSDDNSLTGDWRAYEKDPNLPYGCSDAVLTRWGQVFRDCFLARFDDRRSLTREGRPWVWDNIAPENILSGAGGRPVPVLTGGDPTSEVALPFLPGHGYQAAGVLWEQPVQVATVNFVHGCSHAQDGVFDGDLHLQFSRDGENWELSDWKLLQSYPVSAQRAAGATFTFTGQPALVRGVRIIGSVSIRENSSRYIMIREVQVY